LPTFSEQPEAGPLALKLANGPNLRVGQDSLSLLRGHQVHDQRIRAAETVVFDAAFAPM
jgi:hypothetical protein